MTTHIIDLPQQREARVAIGTPHAQGVNVTSHVFDEHARIIANTATTTYFDFCDAEIAAREVAAMLEDPDDETISKAVEDAGMVCLCDADEDLEEESAA